MTRWGAEQEERSAIAKKAQDAYALGRQAMEKADRALAMIEELSVEVERLRHQINGMERRSASVPVASAPRTRRVA